MIYIDTSAFVKRYHSEEGSDVVNRIFEDARNGVKSIVISLWVVSETINALDKHYLRGEIPKDEFKKVLAAIFNDIEKGIECRYIQVVDIHREILGASWEYITNDHISAGDALHIATALYAGCDEFMAADKKLLKIAESKGLKPINPENIIV